MRMLVTCTQTLQIKQKQGFALVQVCRISAVSSCKCANPGRYANVRVCFQILSILDTVHESLIYHLVYTEEKVNYVCKSENIVI
jgi:hypothetical protein